ncbi:ABC transporter permease [Daejeonella lutea]|uniref:Putative ABC transport system permease protein n=1 Tax=Daejeonella lutea TaxID=572036 RepID=A0A1T5BQK3_9SPHI|nr:ABC transporter permease [Daejeonella lutea]SKB49518.1 putative ABC transport system permease protein [Daejeonella lutea]
MIRHTFKMLWRKRKSNFLLVFQLFISFVALTFFIALNVDKFLAYFKPYYYNYDHVWAISLGLDKVPTDKAQGYVSAIEQKLRAMPEAELVSNASLIPFYSWPTDEKAVIQNNKLSFRTFIADEHFNQVLELPIKKGRWFTKDDRLSAIVPIIITEDLSEEYFNGQDPIGQTILLSGKKTRIVGVTAEYRDNFSREIGGNGKGYIFKPIGPDTTGSAILVKSKYANNFFLMEGKIRKVLETIKDDNFTVRNSSPMNMVKKMSNKNDLIQLTLALVVFGFLVLNIFLGISGVFSYAIAKRRSEIGLRVATGAVSGNILKQFLTETIVLSSFATIPGAFVALQFIIAGFFGNLSLREGMLGVAGAALFIYLLMIACSLYPSLRASKIQPAEALYEE